MKKILLALLVVLTSLSLFAWIPASVEVTGKVMGEVKLDKDGLTTSFTTWDNYVRIVASHPGVSFGITFAPALNITGMWVESDHLKAQWWASNNFSSQLWRLNWFNVLIDEGTMDAPLAVFTFKDAKLDLGFRGAFDDPHKMAIRIRTFDHVVLSSYVRLDGYGFAGAAGELRITDVLGLFNLNAGVSTKDAPPDDYSFFLNPYLERTFDLGQASLYVKPALMFSNLGAANNWVGLYSSLTHDLLAARFNAKYFWLDSTLNLVQFDAKTTVPLGLLTLYGRVGSGDLRADPAALQGNLVADPTALSVIGRLSVKLPFGVEEVLTDPVIALFGGVYFGSDPFGYAANLTISTKLYSVLNLEGFVNFLDLDAWHVRAFATVTF